MIKKPPSYRYIGESNIFINKGATIHQFPTTWSIKLPNGERKEFQYLYIPDWHGKDTPVLLEKFELIQDLD